MSPHIERMEEELEQLNERIAKLGVFIDSNPIFSTLTPFDQMLMVQQFGSMTAYGMTLSIRFGRAKAGDAA